VKLDTERQVELRLRAATGEIPQLRAQLDGLRQSAGAGTVTLAGASDALAAATLQSRLEELAATAGVAIASTESLPAETAGDYRRIGLRMAISGGYDGIVRLLSAIDAATPPLAVDSLQIHGNARVASSRETAQLDAAYIVYGFRNGTVMLEPKP